MSVVCAPAGLSLNKTMVTCSILSPLDFHIIGFIYICVHVTNVSLLVSLSVLWVYICVFSQEKGANVETAKTVKVRKTYDFAGDEVV